MTTTDKNQAIELLFCQAASSKSSVSTHLSKAGFKFHTINSSGDVQEATGKSPQIAILDFDEAPDEILAVAKSLREHDSNLKLIVLCSSPTSENLTPLIELDISSIVTMVDEDIEPLKVALLNSIEFIQVQSFATQQMQLLKKELEDKKEVERKLAKVEEDALEAAQVKSQFLANMSHEIRTPMNGVIGMTMLLLRSELNKRQRRYAETIRGSSESLLTVIDDILDFSRIGSGKLNLQTIDFYFARTVEDVCDTLVPKAQEKGLEIICRLPPTFPPTVQGDPGRLRQVLSNLIANSIKFTETGTIVIEATLEEQRDYDLLVKLSVRDTGVGIPGAALHRLFNSFERVDGSSARKHGGTGLGLAICNQLVELMGGRLGVQSEEGKGSTFWFTIPLTLCTKTPAAQTQNPEALRGKKLLIVDDNPTVQLLLREQAESWNMDTETASNGAEALNLLESNTFDLVTLDWRMPDMSGIDVARELKRNPKLNRTHPIMITAFPQRGHGELAQTSSTVLAK